MFKTINLFVGIFLFLQTAYSQSSNNPFYRKSWAEAVVTYSGFKNQMIEGNYLELKTTLKQTNNGFFLGGEGFLSKSEASFSNSVVNNSTKTVVGSAGLLVGLLKPTKNMISDVRLNFGLTHISQNSNLILLDLFGHLKYVQTQNDWITYIKSQVDIRTNAKVIHQLILGTQYEYPIHSLARASINGGEIKIPSGNRKNLQVWMELGMMQFVINSHYAITCNFQGGYRHFSQNTIDMYKAGVKLALYNTLSEIISLSYNKEFNSIKNSVATENYSVSIDILNLSRK